MILSYRDKRTRLFAQGAFVREFEAFRTQAEKRLMILDAADTLADLGALPSNRLESLGGDRSGAWSIRVNRQWRLCFIWPPGADGPRDVELVDYH